MMLEGSDPIRLDEVRVGQAYETMRGDERRRVAELKRFRRVHLGDSLALVFENRDTIRSTLEEALRTERIDDPDRVAGEVVAFNAVVPASGELAAALFLEVADPADLNAAALRLDGVEQTVFLEVAGTRVRGIPEVVFPPGESPMAHYLRFRLDPEQREAIRSGSTLVAGTDHAACAVAVALDEDQRRAIAEDL
jgi:Protein of unknown function (DUF3501)